MNRTIVNPAHILDSYRKSDAVIIVCQKNELKKLEIAAMNEEAARVTGFSNSELASQSFDMILPERISSTVSEFVEYGDDSHDLLAVLLKIRNFSVKSKDGKELAFRLRVIRGESLDQNPWFHLVLVDEGQQQQINAHRDVIRDSFKAQEVSNEQTGLSSRHTMFRNIETAIEAVKSGRVKASFAVFDINGFEGLRNEYGADVCNAIHRHIGQVCRQKLRPEDAIGSLNDRALALLLVDAPQEESRMVLNRLRWMIGITPMQVKGRDVVTQVNVGFTEIDGKISAGVLLEKCEGFTIAMRGKQFNTIQLAVTHERREKAEDRRKQNIPVEVDRRRKDRRS